MLLIASSAQRLINTVSIGQSPLDCQEWTLSGTDQAATKKMSTCFLMLPNGFLYAMSRHAIGGNGRPPRDSQRPSRGSQSVQSVRRKLFGDVDHRQTGIDLDRQLRQCEADDRSKYNFDFSSEQPIDSPDSRYEWSHVSNDINSTEDKKFNVSTKLCKISDQSIAQSSQQSSTQSAMSSTPEPQPESRRDEKAVSAALGSNSTQSPSLSPTPSATCAPDSQPQSSSSAVEPTSRVEQKHKLVIHTKQKPITGIYPHLLSFS